jgi:very-short-patch-repair endonuclease
MLLIKETIDKYGHDPRDLSKGSDKKVIVQCDYCEKTKEMKNNARSNSLKSYPKDACKNCGGKKRKEALMEKYGVETTQALPDVKAKTKATNLKKFGHESFFGSDAGKEKVKESMLEKYGVEHNMKNKEIRKKRDSTIVKKYGVDNVFKLQEFQDRAINRRIENGSIKTFNGKMIKDLAKEHNYAYSSMVERINKLGIDIATFAKKQESSLELRVAQMLDGLNIKYEKQFKVKNRIADFRLLDSNILIEADGLYWHSDASDKKNDYHFEKRQCYESTGYRCFFFREDEIRDKSDIIKSIILNAIGKSSRVYARKLDVKEVAFKEVKHFLQKNHLMGSANNVSRSIALFDGEDIISVLQLRKIEDDRYDISRFCSLSGLSVVGGFSRLLKFFIKSYKPSYIQTFIDLRYGTGAYLPGLGFELISSHKSFKWTDGCNSFHRLTHRGNSGYENGLYKIWDCGQAKYILNL